MKDGVWRTVGGRRIFIKTGQSLSEAMIESGKFEQEQKQKEAQKILDKKNELDNEIKNVTKEKTKELYDSIKKIKEDPKLNNKEKRELIDKKYDEIRNLENKERQKLINEGKYPTKSEIRKANSSFHTDQIWEEKIKKAMTFEKDFENYKFKSEELENIIINDYVEPDFFGGIHLTPVYSKEFVVALKDLDEIIEKENLMVSKSPYSKSFYAFGSGSITWDSKPEGSYRVADHWNFESRNAIHCKLKNTDEYMQELYLAKYKNGYYEVLKKYE